MADEKKYTIALDNGHTEDVTETQLATIKSRYKRSFPYTVTPIQPAAPAELTTTSKAAKNTPAAASDQAN